MTSQIFQLQKLTAQDTLALRHRVLRPHQSVQDCSFPQDQWPTTFHVGALIEQKVMSIATFHEEAFPRLPARLPYRLRGMATDQSLQGKGIGRKVLEMGMAELKSRGCDLLWCNAREIAFPFYENMELKYNGPLFDIPGLGPHKVMYLYFFGS